MTSMHSVLASSVLGLHPLFIVWVIFGALVARSRALLRWVHITCLIWGILIELRPWPSPLTLLENRLGEPGWRRALPGGFVLHYLDALVYPNISSAVLPVAGVVRLYAESRTLCPYLLDWTQEITIALKLSQSHRFGDTFVRGIFQWRASWN
jgi:Protein of Unknown function (DUF2784)